MSSGSVHNGKAVKGKTLCFGDGCRTHDNREKKMKLWCYFERGMLLHVTKQMRPQCSSEVTLSASELFSYKIEKYDHAICICLLRSQYILYIFHGPSFAVPKL